MLGLKYDIVEVCNAVEVELELWIFDCDQMDDVELFPEGTVEFVVRMVDVEVNS